MSNLVKHRRGIGDLDENEGYYLGDAAIVPASAVAVQTTAAPVSADTTFTLQQIATLGILAAGIYYFFFRKDK